MLGNTPSILPAAIGYCLRPLVRLCLRFGIDYRGLLELLKEAFVLQAIDEIAKSGHVPTDSRISLLTGLYRTDVKRLRGMAEKESSIHKPSLAANLVAYWTGTPALLDEYGNPRPLMRQAVGVGELSFADVARAMTRDTHPRALLDECVRQGVVYIDDDDMVHLNVEILIPDAGLDEKVVIFAHTIHDHIEASGSNLAGDTPAFFDRAVWYVDLTEADAARLAITAEKMAMKALKAVNLQAQEYKQNSIESSEFKNTRIRFGAYFYRTSQSVDSNLLDSKS